MTSKVFSYKLFRLYGNKRLEALAKAYLFAWAIAFWFGRWRLPMTTKALPRELFGNFFGNRTLEDKMTTKAKHTPSCLCYGQDKQRLEHCPLHEAAPEMWELVEMVLALDDAWLSKPLHPAIQQALDKARAIKRQVEGN